MERLAESKKAPVDIYVAVRIYSRRLDETESQLSRLDKANNAE
jgi:hypothetical protein